MTSKAQSQTAHPPQSSKFNFDEVVRRATQLASGPFEGKLPQLPDELNKLGFDAWRQIEFRENKGLLGGDKSQFRLELFHLGHLFKRPVIINTIRDGIPTPIPYQSNAFNFGPAKFTRPLPVNLGFAGFKIRSPLNDPRIYDEFITFIGASYFRFLGRGQRYGLSARGLAINAGTTEEEFPFYREFWIETPKPEVDKLTIYALLDSSAATGAYQFDCYPKENSVVDVRATLIPRQDNAKLGLAPLTSMFFIGANDHRIYGDYRPQLHDSDGLMIHAGSGEWVWRPLRNPMIARTSSFVDKDVQGYGLLQRDRVFSHYQDIDLAYQQRPSYWVEPKTKFGEGHVELFEIPTTDESNDNIVAWWVPKDAPAAGKPLSYGYSITSSLDLSNLSGNAKVLDTLQTSPRALGSAEPEVSHTRRFLVDFKGGDLEYYKDDPAQVGVVASATPGKVIRSFVIYNPFIDGFRATIDIDVPPGQMSDTRAHLKAGLTTLTETWIYPWDAPSEGSK